MEQIITKAKIVLLALTLTTSLGGVILPATASAQEEATVNSAAESLNFLDKLEGKVFGQEPRKDYDRVSATVAGIMQAVLGLVGLILVIIIAYSGILWMTARGNDEQVERARKYISNSIIGLIIVLFAYTITTFVIQQLATSVFESRFSPY